MYVVLIRRPTEHKGKRIIKARRNKIAKTNMFVKLSGKCVSVSVFKVNEEAIKLQEGRFKYASSYQLLYIFICICGGF